MFIVILIVFGGCWLPYHTYFIYTYYHTVKGIVYSESHRNYQKKTSQLFRYNIMYSETSQTL